MTTMLLQAPVLGVQQGVQQAFIAVRGFIASDSMVAAEVIFGSILVFHVLIGAAELVVGQESRFFSGAFWVRIVFVGLVTFGFTEIFVTLGDALCSSAFSRIVDAFCTLWNQIVDLSVKNSSDQMEVMVSGDVWDLLVGGINAFMEFIIALCSFIISATVAFLLLLYVWFQALLGMGTALLTLAMGPICLPFGAHEATQDVAIGYLKTFLIYVVLYLPLLVLAFEIALNFMAAQTAFTWGAHFHDWSSFGSYMMGFLTAPVAAVALVQSVPSLIRGALR